MAGKGGGGFVGAAVVVVGLVVVFGHGCSGSSTGASRPDWCFTFDRASGQMQNITDGIANGTATVGDEAHMFDQLAGDLSDVGLVTSGVVGAAAQAGAVDAGQVRVGLLSGSGVASAAGDLKVQMDTLSPKCGD